jgi:hypothetical protein
MEAEGSLIKYDVRTTRESHRVSQVKRVHEKEGGGERGAGLMYYVHTYICTSQGATHLHLHSTLQGES